MRRTGRPLLTRPPLLPPESALPTATHDAWPKRRFLPRNQRGLVGRGPVGWRGRLFVVCYLWFALRQDCSAFGTDKAMRWNRVANRPGFVGRGQSPARRVRFEPDGDRLLTTYEPGGPKTWLLE